MENNNHGNTAMIMIITAMDQNQALPCFSDFIAYSCGSYGSSCWVLKNTCFGVNVATSQSVHQYVIRCDAYSQQICSNNKLIVTAGTAHFMWLNDTESFLENRTGRKNRSWTLLTGCCKTTTSLQCPGRSVALSLRQIEKEFIHGPRHPRRVFLR